MDNTIYLVDIFIFFYFFVEVIRLSVKLMEFFLFLFCVERFLERMVVFVVVKGVQEVIFVDYKLIKVIGSVRDSSLMNIL